MRKHRGFTLIELVVVVMILGILAAVAAPKLLNTSGAASDNALKESLGVVRDAIERYAAEHGGTLPDGTSEATFKAALTNYIRTFPKNPISNTADVAVVTTTTVTGATAWMYNKADGTFIANSSAATKTDPTVHYNEL